MAEGQQAGLPWLLDAEWSVFYSNKTQLRNT